MATEKTGNLQEVHDALALAPQEKQKFPFAEWYLITVRPSHEIQAANAFRRSMIRAYWPNYVKLVPVRALRNGRLTRRNMPVAVIPGYIFSPAGAGEDFHDLVETIPEVINIVRTHSGDVLIVHQADIEIIRRIEAGLNTPEPLKKAVHSFRMGYKVRFIDDLTGRWPPGKIERLYADGRISIEVPLMGRMVPVTVLPHQIERT